MRWRCPTCKAQAVEAYLPFCSDRCAQIDLGRWFSESYHIPAERAEMDEEETEALITALESGTDTESSQ